MSAGASLRLPVTPAEELTELREAYASSLPRPLDGMWEAFAGMAEHRALELDGERVGYFCVDGEGQLLQFHLLAGPDPEAIFAQALKESGARTAVAATFEPWFPLALDHAREGGVEVNALLYRLEGQPVGRAPELEEVEETERGEVETFVRGSFPADPGDWVTGYLANLVQRAELFALREDGRVVGTGELRRSNTWHGWADLGVIVGTEERGRGRATAILGELVERGRQEGLELICSTTSENVGARRAIGRAGFVARDRQVVVRA